MSFISLLWVCPIDLGDLYRLPVIRPQKAERGAAAGASKEDSVKMEDMTVEQITMKANQVTDEVSLAPSHRVHRGAP